MFYAFFVPQPKSTFSTVISSFGYRSCSRCYYQEAKPLSSAKQSKTSSTQFDVHFKREALVHKGAGQAFVTLICQSNSERDNELTNSFRLRFLLKLNPVN